jgi:hypothetical protein
MACSIFVTWNDAQAGAVVNAARAASTGRDRRFIIANLRMEGATVSEIATEGKLN